MVGSPRLLDGTGRSGHRGGARPRARVRRAARGARLPGRRAWHARARARRVRRGHDAHRRPRARSPRRTACRTCRIARRPHRAARRSSAWSATVEAELGPIDILVHNAGGDIAAAGGKPDPNDAVCIKEADVRAVLERNLLSTILVCQRVARGMMERRRGRIVTISSIAAFHGPRARRRSTPRPRPASSHYTRCLADAAAALRRHRQLAGARRHAHRPLPRHARRSDPDAPGRGTARSSASPRSTRWRAWSSSSPGRSAPSSRARCCGSMAAPSAGRVEPSTARHDAPTRSCGPAHLAHRIRLRVSVPPRGPPAQPRPTNGILVAMMVMNWTLASSGRLAMWTHGARRRAARPSAARPRSCRRPAARPSFMRAVISVAALPMSIWPQAMSYLPAVERGRLGQAGDRVLGRGVGRRVRAAARAPRSSRC